MSERRARRSSRARGGLEGISRIAVCGYKSLKHEQEIEIRPLTLLAGANSSGKTSIMQPLLMLKQTLEAPYDPGPLLLDGPYVKFTSVGQLLSRSKKRECSGSFSIALGAHDDSKVRLSFKRDPKGLAIESLRFRDNGEGEHTLYEGMPEAELVAALPKALREIKPAVESRDRQKRRWVIVRNRWMLGVGLQRTEGDDSTYLLGAPAGLFAAHIERVIHLPGLRANPSREYPATPLSGAFAGSFEKYVASVVTGWQADQSGSLEALGRSMEDLGLTWKVRAKRLDDTRVELQVGRLPHSRQGGAQDLVSIADVGVGVSQALPVVVALLVARPGSILYIEQPEIHLHPRAQVAMARLLVDAAKRGVGVVAETHSSVILRSVQTLAARGEVAPEIVKLHWFTRDPRDGSTRVDSADIDKRGAFGPWPSDFDDVSLQVETDYLDAVEKRDSGQ
jgi:hypothetical protein